MLLSAAPMLVFFMQLAANGFLKALKIKISNQLVVILCCAAGHAPIAAILWTVYLQKIASASELTLAALYCLIVYNALAYSYFHLFNMSETARRIRILYEIYSTGVLSASQIASSYNPSVMVKNRIERLVAMRQIKQSGNRYFLDQRLIFAVSSAVAGWGALLSIPYPAMRKSASNGKARLGQSLVKQDAKQDAA